MSSLPNLSRDCRALDGDFDELRSDADVSWFVETLRLVNMPPSVYLVFC